jgi:hypothetical protein
VRTARQNTKLTRATTTTYHPRTNTKPTQSYDRTHLLQNQQGDDNGDDCPNRLSIQPTTIGCGCRRSSSEERSSDRLAADPGDLAERVNDLCHGGLRLACGCVGETEAVRE